MSKKLLLVLLAVMIAVAAIAAPPAAGTKIKNQAAATYTDGRGVTRTILSNQVITTVLPVYSVLVTPDLIEQPGAAGQTMQFQFRIDNLANTVDTFNTSVNIDPASTFTPQNIEVFYDENGNGVVDPGEELWNNTIPISSGDFRYVIVRYRVPSAAAAGTTATVYLDVDSVSDPVNAFDHDNAARTTVYNDAVLTLFKSATPQEVKAGDEVVYTISGANVGNKAASDITIIDVLPASLEYLGFLDKVPAGMTVNVTGNTVTLHIANLTAGSGFQIRLRVQVKADTLAGIIENVATMTYKTTALETVSRSSNVSTIMVGGPGNETTKVWIGPKGNPEAVDPNDITIKPGVAGTLVEFTNTVKNAGLSTDIINITIADVIPEGLDNVVAISFFTENLTPLPDTDDNGMQDTGPLAPGETFDITVKLFIPADIDVSVTSITALVRAISSISPASSDTTTDKVEPITFPSVAIGNMSGTATDTTVDKESVNKNADPGSYAYFPLDVVNNSDAGDTFSLSADLPAGYTVRFYIDTNGNGVLDPDEMIPITNTGQVSPNSGIRIIARVTVPEGALYTGVAVPVTFYATSLTRPTVEDSQTNTITVNAVRHITLLPSRNGSAAPGQNIDYEHTLTNTGNVAVTVKLYPSSTRGWDFTFLQGGNPVDLDATWPLEPGQSVTGIFRLEVPSDEPLGVTDVAYLRAEVQEDTNVTATVIDITAVVSEKVTLEKAVNKTDAKPGEQLIYTITYADVGTEPINNLIIYDTIPFYTSLDPVIVTDTINFTEPSQVSTDYGVTWEDWATFDKNNLASVTTVKWIIGTLTAGGSGTVVFPVLIDGY
ncbi:MAG: hypothetical protein WAZ22_12680 [Mesotoga infera]